MRWSFYILLIPITVFAEPGRKPTTARDFQRVAANAQNLIKQEQWGDAVRVIQEGLMEATFEPELEFPGPPSGIGLALLRQLPPKGVEAYELLYGAKARRDLEKVVPSD